MARGKRVWRRSGTALVASMTAVVVAGMPAFAEPVCHSVESNYVCVTTDPNEEIRVEAFVGVSTRDFAISVFKGYRPDGGGFLITVCVRLAERQRCQDVAHP